MGLGIGRALIEDAEARARASGAAELSVISGPEAVGFYEAVGFVRGPETPTQFGPAWTLHLAL